MWVAGSALTILLFFVDLFLAIILFPFDKKRKIVHAQCFWWSDIIIGMNPFWALEVKGMENIDPNQAYVVVANHQSMADIFVLYKTRLQFKWVAKESLFKVPFLGWCLSLGKHIKLTRQQFGSIKRVYREASYWLKNDVSVLFFPEGTRSKTGAIKEFQNGAFKLAIKEKKPVLPVAISGTMDAIPKGSWIFKTKVVCKLTILPPVETSELSVGDFSDLKNKIYAGFAEL